MPRSRGASWALASIPSFTKPICLGLSDDLPEKIEVVDRPEEIDRLLPVLDQMIGGGLIVVEDVHVVRYLHDPKGEKGLVS